MAGAVPTGTVTFLFTDIEGSTRLWETHPDEMEVALEQHDDVLRTAIEGHDGYVFSTRGDGVAAAFGRTDDARAAATEIVDRLESVEWSVSPIRARLGLHVGAAQERDGDYFGPAVNRAARIMSVGHGGQILVSSAFAELVDGVALFDLGEHSLKDLDRPERLWQLGEGRFPPLRTMGDFGHNLPAQRTALFGRDAAVADIGRVIADNRLVTILGIGGTGKTRLATAIAAELVHRFPDGAWFVDLVPAGSTVQTVEAIASATGLQVAGDDLVGGLSDALSDREMLLVLDNCEHITDEVADLVDGLLDTTTSARFLATSREPLQLPDERQVQLDPLVVTADESSPAVQLFVAAAQRVGVEIGPGELATVARIADQLDGLPLSIELAAAQLRQFRLDELAARLDQRFELLAQRRSGRRRRQASLQAVLDDTWSMLDDRERLMLLYLAAFPASFALSDAETLAVDLNVGSPPATLAGLTDRGLVAHPDAGRHQLLETVKLYARRRWDDEADPDVFAERHTRWLFDQIGRFSTEDRYVSFELADWMNFHHDDRLAVEARFAAGGRYDELAELYAASTITATFQTGVRAAGLIERVARHLATLDLDPLQAAPLQLAASSAALPARRPEWFDRARTAIEQFRSADQPQALASALIVASYMPALSDLDAALDMLGEARETADAVGATVLGTVALAYSAMYMGVAGERDRAIATLAAVEPRLANDGDNYDRSADQSARFIVFVLDDPQAMRAPLEAEVARRTGGGRDDWAVRVCLSCVLASLGDVAATQAGVVDAEACVRRFGADDGLPDLLVPMAILAWRVGDHQRSTRWVTAIRRAPRPTHNFLITGAYRGVRDRVGLLDDNPLESTTIEAVYGEAREWLRTLPAGDRSS